MTISTIRPTARLRWLETGDGHEDDPITMTLQQLYEIVGDCKITEEWCDVETVRKP